jgi:hypothetical protein
MFGFSFRDFFFHFIFFSLCVPVESFPIKAFACNTYLSVSIFSDVVVVVATNVVKTKKEILVKKINGRVDIGWVLRFVFRGECWFKLAKKFNGNVHLERERLFFSTSYFYGLKEL